ncbi:MAG: M1 family metallopeptidase [Saprospiraceae bacterium]|nr:M1 family metallopeptidase [Saprospiraceae bacterium]
MKTLYRILLIITPIALISCVDQPNKASIIREEDPHSFSNPLICSVEHLDLDLEVSFDLQKISGTAEYKIATNCSDSLILDFMELTILDVSVYNGSEYSKVNFRITPKDSILGNGLVIPIPKDTRTVRIQYETGKDAIALQWVPAEQTASKKHPFLFTQSQSIYARSWVPSPDGPGMRFTYQARIKVPQELMVVMSADGASEKNDSGIYHFKMDLPIPAYLMAMAVGDFGFKSIGQRTGVYAPKEWLEQARWEFEDLEKMLIATENLYGPYPWERYDVIVLPASFPFGGMENPRMTFLTPTVIAGDRSLTALLAHELAHSWSGNLVTNASWNDFWLNEGFTTYIESRIMENLYGKDYADMLSLLGLQDLKTSIDDMGENNPMTCLHLNLKDIDPEEALTDIAYEKGKSLLRFLEERKGRAALDTFLKAYFKEFAFKSNTSQGFMDFVKKQLLPENDPMLDTIHMWVYKPGFPLVTGNYSRQKFDRVEEYTAKILSGSEPDTIQTANWSTHEYLHFIRNLPDSKNPDLCLKLDRYYNFKESRNAEIRCAWMIYSIENQYTSYIMPSIEHFLGSVGRRKFILPIYEALMDHGFQNDARRIFTRFSPLYHPISRISIEKELEG